MLNAGQSTMPPPAFVTDTDRVKYLRIALLLVGLIFIVGIYPLTLLWPSGWSWNTGQSEYLQMILGDLRDTWRIPGDRFSQPPCASESFEVKERLPPQGGIEWPTKWLTRGLNWRRVERDR